MKEKFLPLFRSIHKDYLDVYNKIIHMEYYYDMYDLIEENCMDYGICAYFGYYKRKRDMDFEIIIKKYLLLNNNLSDYITRTPSIIRIIGSDVKDETINSFKKRIEALEEIIGLISCDLIKIEE